ncbi:DUF771 domain-containing protein [Lysinibacillus sp. SGAir0095]|uniref:DUF771 domain-containing protein n=1 Tax=Lysinibacillus sp. SGAir0095 TaxID=2070463 RepID=UPI0010CD14DB|nr:DUF771 domain-containing protein [Lysinibacillus sp. SGAir0095]QCR33165.1 DUF771 domain-containing protein [Lysinibacillus sp. SGAir0095]
MQNLEVNLTIPIPKDMVLIKKVELEEMKEKSIKGLYWTMKDLEQRTGKKHEWVKENILFPTKFKKQLDVVNGGFVYYPTKSGEKWVFQASKMAKFLDDNFHMIFGKG